MTSDNRDIISALTVEVHKADSSREKLGTGVIYTNKKLQGHSYVLTAKHCLVNISEGESLSLRILNPSNGKYEYVFLVNQEIIRHPSLDAAVIIVNEKELFAVNPNIPAVYFVDSRADYENAVTKGYPVSALDQKSPYGESSLAALTLRFLQYSSSSDEFQLSTENDYTADTIKGMSGAGIFIEACEELYLAGIFIRFSDEDRGKVVYAQCLAPFNELLGFEFKIKIPSAFIGRYGLGHRKFEENVKQSIANLGPRYCAKVNVKTGTAKCFDCIAKSPEYYERLIHSLDTWLTERIGMTRTGSGVIDNLEDSLISLQSDFSSALKELNRDVASPIKLSAYRDRIVSFQNEVGNARHLFYSKLTVKDLDKKSKDEIEANESRLRKISQTINYLLEAYDEQMIDLANEPYLIITGEAGCGKSHLLGDAANRRISCGLPTLLFLGTDFSDATYESTIISKIGFKGSFQELMSGLNQIGLQIGSRVLLIIDAINEGANASEWKCKLPGLIESIKQYPAVGLVVSVRDTYFEDIIPQDIEKTHNVTIIEHKGFKGLEYEAVKHFCEVYELNLPNVPILTPEFCNPLFLKIICDTLKASGKKDFPKGFNGVSSIFSQYFEILDKQFACKRDEYKFLSVVTTAVRTLAVPFFEAKTNLLKTQDVYQILYQKFPTCNCLLTDLINSNILIKTKSKYTNDGENYIGFCYQRISDFIIAGELVSRYPNWESFSDNISADNELRAIFIEPHWTIRGVIEALSILIPETYDREITDVIGFIPNENRKRFEFSILPMLSESLINSLNWRSVESIDKEAILRFLKSDYSNIETEEWYYKLAEISVIPDHPFNADYFHALMMHFNMSKRDGKFQFFFNGCAGYDDNHCANSFRRLIDWAWSDDVSQKTDDESARLASIMLCWLLSSTCIKNRDEATKALVNLLVEKTDVLVNLMQSFDGVDDMYITERIYAVSYGVALRTSSIEGLTRLAQYVYDRVFKQGNPPKNILLRDYARNVIEYAKYRNCALRVNMKKIKPPFKSDLPQWPDDDDIDYLHVDYNDPDYSQKSGSEQNLIWESVKGGLADFWEKTAEPVLEDFYPISLADEKLYRDAERMFKGKMKQCVRLFTESKARMALSTWDVAGKDPVYYNLLNALNEGFEKLVTPEQLAAVTQIMIPFKAKELELKRKTFIKFPTNGIRNWIVKRAYGLGFDVNLHGRYDRLAKDWTFRNPENRIDRIGKKYQWIAFYEVMGILSDNYKYKSDYANGGRGDYELFHGTWQSFLRNINPSMVRRKSIQSTFEMDMVEIGERKWWMEGTDFTNWQYGDNDEDWTSLLRDLPACESLIQKIDDNGDAWLALSCSMNWKEPKEIGEEKYAYKLKKHDVYLSANALLVQKDNLTKAVYDLSGRNLWKDVWFPSDNGQCLFNREKYWSPAYKDVYRDNLDGESDDNIPILTVPYIYTSEQACGYIDRDKSGTIESYCIPCKLLFDGLEMNYDSKDEQYVDKDGNLIALSFDNDNIFVRKKLLVDFLKRQGLEILWIIRGEKRAYVSGGMGCVSKHDPCGVYYLDNDNTPVGDIKMYKRI